MDISPEVRQRLAEIGQMPEVLPREQWHDHCVTELKPGGVVRVNDVTYRVLTKHRYEESGYEWFTTTLLGLSDGSTRYLGWDEIEGLHITFGEPEMTLEEIGTSAEWLQRAEANGFGTLNHERSYPYKESSPANFYKDCGSKNEKLYYWLFESGDYGLSVEKFGTKYSAYLYRKIPASAVEILSVG